MALQIGDIVPNFTAKDNYGNDFDSKDYLGKKTLVIYFYPKNDTRVCTNKLAVLAIITKILKHLAQK